MKGVYIGERSARVTCGAWGVRADGGSGKTLEDEGRRIGLQGLLEIDFWMIWCEGEHAVGENGWRVRDRH